MLFNPNKTPIEIIKEGASGFVSKILMDGFNGIFGII